MPMTYQDTIKELVYGCDEEGDECEGYAHAVRRLGVNLEDTIFVVIGTYDDETGEAITYSEEKTIASILGDIAAAADRYHYEPVFNSVEDIRRNYVEAVEEGGRDAVLVWGDDWTRHQEIFGH